MASPSSQPTRADTVKAASEILEALQRHNGELISEKERVGMLARAKQLVMALEKPEDGLIKIAFAVCTYLFTISVQSALGPDSSDAKGFAIACGVDGHPCLR